MNDEEKAAIVLLALEEELAASVIKNLRPSEIRRVGKHMTRLTSIPAETVTAVLKEFIALAKEKGGALSVGDDITKNIMTKVLGEEAASEFMTDALANRTYDNPIVDKLREIDPKLLIEFTRTEHPQTIALIMSNMSSEQAASMLETFTGPMQLEVVKRMSTLKSVPYEFLEDVAKTLERELMSDNLTEQQVGGMKVMSDILTRMSRTSENAILSSLEEEDAELAAQLRALMFTFDDVLKLDDKSLQDLLREVATEDLSKALKMVDVTLREKVYRNMSRRGAEMLKEDIEMMPPIRLSEVETSQRTILETVKKLEAEGRLVIERGGGGGGDSFV